MSMTPTMAASRVGYSFRAHAPVVKPPWPNSFILLAWTNNAHRNAWIPEYKGRL